MSTFDRLELITEIEALALGLGVVFKIRLEDLTGAELVNLQVSLSSVESK